MNPYYLMTLLYLALAALAALDTSLVNLQILPGFPGQRWIMVHSITLGVLVQLVFGLVPELTASLARLRKPTFRWSTWLLLNGGLLVLFIGIPLVNEPLLITGGTLIFLAASLVIKQLFDLGRVRAAGEPKPSGEQGEAGATAQGVWFYVSGITYLLVGILVGTGLWIGWAAPLHIMVPKEVHVHSNLWGFTAIVLAGLLIDLYPSFTGRKLARPGLVTWTFWLMTVGALGMIIGPWVNIDSFTVYGLVLHTIGTLLMLVNMVIPLWRKGKEWTAGIWHLAVAYIWFILAVVVAPLVVAGGNVGSEVAGSGGPILIFGWILQVGYALIPLVYTRVFRPDQPARLGGSWFTLAALNAGNLVYWISMFVTAGRAPMRSAAYLLWIVSLIPILMTLAALVRNKLEQIRGQEKALP